ncbi:hypothetical protein ACI2KR_07765 [Pseudomonas luteola]
MATTIHLHNGLLAKNWACRAAETIQEGSLKGLLLNLSEQTDVNAELRNIIHQRLGSTQYFVISFGSSTDDKQHIRGYLDKGSAKLLRECSGLTLASLSTDDISVLSTHITTLIGEMISNSPGETVLMTHLGVNEPKALCLPTLQDLENLRTIIMWSGLSATGELSYELLNQLDLHPDI